MKTVYVGLSGGVDSAVSAALLKREGYNVVGAFIKIWQPEFIECTWREDRLDAMRVCAALEIPYREIDLSEEYKRDVVNTMIRDYERGITPNPDVLCNEKTKFGDFFTWARAEGAEYVATGHYARTKEGRLLRGVDREKDQSYFLYRLAEEVLSQTLFPVGEFTKEHVRQLALTYNLPVARKKDSQGLCFVGEVSMRDFLKRYISVERGPVIDGSGKEIGEHEGAALYTVGQRHGFKVRYGDGAHYYVISVDAQKNIVQVSKNRDDAMRRDVALRDVHWIGKPSFPFEADVEARYREKSVRAQIVNDSSAVCKEPHILAPGQSLVVYQGEQCLGGGVIK